MSGEHWYTADGKPYYSMIGANGNERAVTLRDARKVGACPSVTTVLSIIAKPALTAWMVNQGILAALTLPRVDGETHEDLMRRINTDSRQQAKSAAEEGSRIHDAIEQSFIGGVVPDAYLPHVEATRAEIARIFPDVSDWIAERSFSSPHGFGGKVDLHSPSAGIVIDYKGKDLAPEDTKKLAYDQHYQLAAYQCGLGLRRSQCANIFVSRNHPGCVVSHVWSETEIADGIGIFLDALSLWKRIRGYDPNLKPAADGSR